MIVLNKIKSKNEGDDLILSSLLEIDENNFELAVRIKGLEWHKYAVTDRSVRCFFVGSVTICNASWT